MLASLFNQFAAGTVCFHKISTLRIRWNYGLLCSVKKVSAIFLNSTIKAQLLAKTRCSFLILRNAWQTKSDIYNSSFKTKKFSKFSIKSNFIKKINRHDCIPVNFVNFFRTVFFLQKTSGWILPGRKIWYFHAKKFTLKNKNK